MPLRLNTFGGLALERDGVLMSGRITQRRRLALLVLLARAPNAFASRDRLLALLWPERNEARARHALSQAIYAVRQDLGEAAVLSGVDELRLNPEIITSDVADFEDAVRSGDPGRVVELYRGGFLEGFLLSDAPEFERWVDSERALLEHEYRLALGTLAARALESGDVAMAVRWLRRHAALEPTNSEIALRLMRALVAAGDHAGALQWYRTHAAIRREDLGAEPDGALVALARELSATPAKPAAVPDPLAASAAMDPPAPPGPPQHEAGAHDAAGRALAAGTPGPAAAMTPAAGAPAATDAAHAAGIPDPAPATVPAAAADIGEDQPAGPASAPPVGASRPSPRRIPRRRVRSLAVAAVFVLLSMLGTVAVWRARTATLNPRAIVLAVVSGPDSTLSLVVREGLRAELEQSASIRVLSDATAARTLELMLRPATEPVTPPVAIEIAQRRGIPFVVTAGARPVGDGVQLIARVLDARTERLLATATQYPPDEASLLPAIADLANAIRAGVFGVEPTALEPLPAVSTRSLPALRSYALARQALARSDEQRALELAEAALVHDSLFVLAHYLAGHLLWYIDQQRHSDEHITRAYELSARLPIRERLIVRARYEQLVRDRPDSALVYWKLLADSHPDEALAYEGMRWVYRALGNTRAMADAAEEAFDRDPSQRLTYHLDRIDERLAAGDTATAYRLASEVADVAPTFGQHVRYRWALLTGNASAALGLTLRPPERQIALLLAWRVDEAARLLPEVRPAGMQYYPRALLAQARMDLEADSQPRARALLREAIDWVEDADLSPPAYARLVERAAELAARLRDAAALRRLRALIDSHDRGRSLRSYTMARTTLDAADAFARGNMRTSAELAARAARGVFYARSLATIKLLEADARAAAGDSQAARAQYRTLAAPLTLQDGDLETRALVRAIAMRRLGAGVVR